MKIALIGATGFVGSKVLEELVSRDHQVTAIARNLEKITLENELITLKPADILNSSEVSEAVAGNDAVISAFNPGWTNPNIYKDSIEGYKSIQEGVKQSGIKRLLVVGGAGSLEVAPGVQLVDTPDFPAEYKAGASAARDYLNLIKTETELDWTFLSPAIEMHPGTSGVRKGVYRTGEDNPVFNEKGRSIISAEDLAVAIADEIEQSNFVKKRFTAAY
ncbi:NAD(P)-dependent oxidoreductase [Dyadobacter sediminis]|uniref:NAD(P)-dependent oxidoreductase n=1 Tax=Dyadobacter sediminis TaxID=1493691 RepID=A0A5R9KJF8_9BACT|nr:NAD(P)-dependent oxidoreductase [Dyadobacter sediminis]TLU96259.1 NAD(P)-dependent oxidoreductase [Dyadobacter sediminis]GGB80630.1 3-beta hydroxysteroid dehydrogenase [Dyadobacter sediminis]